VLWDFLCEIVSGIQLSIIAAHNEFVHQFTSLLYLGVIKLLLSFILLCGQLDFIHLVCLFCYALHCKQLNRHTSKFGFSSVGRNTPFC